MNGKADLLIDLELVAKPAALELNVTEVLGWVHKQRLVFLLFCHEVNALIPLQVLWLNHVPSNLDLILVKLDFVGQFTPRKNNLLH